MASNGISEADVTTLQNASEKQWGFITETLKLSLPLIVSNLVSILITFISVLMLGRLGHMTLAASALVTSSQTTVLVVSLGIIFSISVMVGQAYGAKNHREIGGIMQQGFLLGMIICIPVMLIFWNIGPILLSLGQQPVLVNMVVQYFHAYIWSVPASICLACGIQMLTGLQKRSAIFILSVANLFLIVETGWILIFGKFGFHSYGIAGLGYAWVIQSWVVLAALLSYLYFSPDYKPYLLFQLRIRESFPILIKLIRIGWPICVQMGIELFAFFIGTLMAGWIDATSLAARQISVQFLLLLLIPIFGVSQASGVLVSRAVGGKRPDDIKHYGNYGILLGLIIAILTLIILFAFAKPLIGLFININDPSNTPILYLAATLLMVIAVGQIFDSVRNICTGALRGLYDTKFPMFISLICLWFLALPLGYYLAFKFHWGVLGLSFANNISLALGSILLFYRWRHRSEKIS